MHQPLVSIIIPTYNRAHMIGETLDSILVQTYTNWECIVVDDGSTDSTAELLLQYCTNDKRFQYHHRPNDRPKGANTCRNYGFELSKGEYINWFDDDDIMLNNFLDIKLNVFSRDMNFVICSGYISNMNLTKRRVINIELIDKSMLFQEYLLWNLQILTPSILFRRGFLNENDLFLDFLSRGQEAEFFSRIFININIEEFEIINIPLFIYRQHKNNKTTRNIKYVNEFKKSESFLYLENLRRSLFLKNRQLVQFCYKQLVTLFFKGIVNKHYSNSKFILRGMVDVLKEKNKILMFRWTVLGGLSILIKRRSYKIKRSLYKSEILF